MGEDVALVDLPYLRRRADEDRLTLTLAEHLGKSEGFDLPTLQRSLPRIRDGAVDGRGLVPVVYTANDNVDLWSNPRWMQNWERSSIE